MLTLAGRITKGPIDRRSAPAVPLNSSRPRQSELTDHRSGGLDAGEHRARVRWCGIRLAGGRSCLPAQAVWGNEAARARLESWNLEVGTVRRRIEMIFGTCKRSYGLRRMRWLGLAKAGLQVRLTAIAYNLRRSVTILGTRIGRSGG